MIQFRVVKGAVAVAGLLALTACSGDQAGPSGGDSNIVQGNGQITVVAPADRQPVPELSGETVDGEQLSIADYEGDVLVLNFWGAWCAPCIAEADNLVTIAEETADQGVQFVGINTRDPSVENARAFEERHEVPYPSLYDPDGRMLLEFPRGSLNPQAIPSTLIVDREGRIAVRLLKPLTEDELRDALEPVIAEG
ncbi:redoxin domain-containing protein [Streptomyces sp. 3MP-14]|uniref:Redoxin domain-containing protein n=1 Tax=Streptomyces mimosae TaxID=2586635 RepID=A0A5N5ZPV0_9ACTN|nr:MULTISPECIES: TlpA disulfide reductase family protein [Streptomyces]KAB8158325.1 redoxin domain-containing protein [Streptomyces mimosae]KAB8176860.1 redoxin domain-containing protein [Streptomyces sp. 3MP-14]